MINFIDKDNSLKKKKKEDMFQKEELAETKDRLDYVSYL